jgi:benzoyl-CoA reductase/2-hydroxyglutaryl-CoA dehydratase subunit BcrC/BadD/HgdB
LADAYLGKPAGSYKTAFDSRLEYIEGQLERHDIEKVVMLTPKFCDSHMLRTSAIRDRLEATGRDCLELTYEHSIVDEGQLRLRVQSFFD